MLDFGDHPFLSFRVEAFGHPKRVESVVDVVGDLAVEESVVFDEGLQSRKHAIIIVVVMLLPLPPRRRWWLFFRRRRRRRHDAHEKSPVDFLVFLYRTEGGIAGKHEDGYLPARRGDDG